MNNDKGHDQHDLFYKKGEYYLIHLYMTHSNIEGLFQFEE